ncbi:hypothetical protein [Mahella australiensis]|uniref:Glutamate synthase (NADPH) GltB3 subunit n=1 Tax=Mahella australiensis (strain DSM 15567 / CIP 107919 / 50-1 BON) TaxID=697281 RepID=F4A053_MAHA5|nr:hypothetical protein [Mahella australiensis]AEE96887.1 glutamate synthase (NADPH) GltB3 subunit [Mahella australiensis 50-1 BON]
MKVIDANAMHYQQLNALLKQAAASGEDDIRVLNVRGQRYIGDGMRGNLTITVEGIPGNDMAAFMDGPMIVVKGNTQDAVGNTMNAGKVVINGHAGDTIGYAMRGGTIFVRDDVGYRVGIHMKEYEDKIPAIVVGGKAGDFFGEYMAGGILILLGIGLQADESVVGNYCGTGMHGGVIYIRGEVDKYRLGKEADMQSIDDKDQKVLRMYIEQFAEYFDYDAEDILNGTFTKLVPFGKRPYGKLYS